MKAYVLAVGLRLAALPLDATGAPAGKVADPSEVDLRLLSVSLDGSILADALPCYQDKNGVLVPLGEMSRLLELGIEVDIPAGRASGFFLSEDRRFDLDAGGGTATVEGMTKLFDPSRIELHSDDLYIDTTLLSEWLPLSLDVDLLGSIITVRPREKLPLQLRIERERAFERTGASAAPPHFPRLEIPYRIMDGPFIDQTLRFKSEPLPGRGRVNGLESSTYLTGELLFVDASAFVTGSEDGIIDSRFSLGRKDPYGKLLGPLRAREVTVGDVFHPGLDLVAQPHSGPGLLVSNFPLQHPTQFDRQSFRGDLPPGWEVELYRGDELLAYARSRSDGLYEFLDVPLLFGLNAFRLQLYGPLGQRRTETRFFNVGETLTPKGQLYYRLVGNDPSARLLGRGPADVQQRASLELSIGLARSLSANASLATVEFAGSRHEYETLGIRAFRGSFFTDVDVALDRSGGSAVQGTLQSRRGAVGFQLQHAILDGFASERFSSAGPLRSRTSLRIDTVLPESFLPRIALLFDVRQDRLESGNQVTTLSGRASTFRKGLSVANELSWSFSGGQGGSFPARGTGDLLVNRYLRSCSFRGEVHYDVSPVWEITNVALTAERRLGQGLLVSAAIDRVVLDSLTRLQAGFSKTEGTFGFGVTGDYSRPGGAGASIFLAVAAGRDPRNDTWHSQAHPLAGSGAVSGRAFLDANGNGIKDSNEEPIAGVGFLLNGGGSVVRTDEVGDAFLTNLAPYQPLDLSLASSTLEDPFWKPAREGVRIVPRPGKVALVDFPIQVTGEITGTVRLRRDGASHDASGVELQLVDAEGAVVMAVRSAYDGFYDFAQLRPGRYTLRIAAEETARHHLTALPAPREVEMAPAGTVLDGVDFELEGAPSANPPATSSYK